MPSEFQRFHRATSSDADLRQMLPVNAVCDLTHALNTSIDEIPGTLNASIQALLSTAGRGIDDIPVLLSTADRDILYDILSTAYKRFGDIHE